MSCDNPTDAILYQLAWDYCAQESLSEKGLRKRIKKLTRNGITTCDFRYHRSLRIAGIFLPRIDCHTSVLHVVCNNEKVVDGMVQNLLTYYPDAANCTDDDGNTPLHVACSNNNVTVNIVHLLVDAAPNSIRSVSSNHGWTPLHYFCNNGKDDEKMEILKLLLEKHPEAVRHTDSLDCLPIHIAAAMSESPGFCRVLIEAYPGSERISNSSNGLLPLHYACAKNTVATVEYLYTLYPGAINVMVDGGYPIHAAIVGLIQRSKPAAAVDIVRFLLGCDPKVKLQKHQGRMSLLDFACHGEYNSNIEAGIQIIMLIYDAHPEMIENNEIASNIHHYHQSVQSFINRQLLYSRQAKDHSLSTAPNGNGQLPLHIALRDSITLGSIKLLAAGNPSALQTPDNSGVLPLHVACEHEDSARVVQYLLGFDASTLHAVDAKQNAALHYACRSAKYDTISLLLGKYDAASVSRRNEQGKLPIDLLWESDGVEDRESIEYTESIFCLLKAYPETVMNFDNIDVSQQSILKQPPRRSQKKKSFWKNLSFFRSRNNSSLVASTSLSSIPDTR